MVAFANYLAGNYLPKDGRGPNFPLPPNAATPEPARNGMSTTPGPGGMDLKRKQQQTPAMPMGGPPAPPSSTTPAKSANVGLGDIDIDSIPASLKREGSDWLAVYNPKTAPAVSVDLLHNLDHPTVVCCVKFSNDGKYLATGCNKSAQVFDVTTGS